MIIREDVDLRPYNTFGIAARAARFAEVDSVEALYEVRSGHDGPIFVLGGGSNIVLTRDFDGLVLLMALRGRAQEGRNAEARYIRAGAGENWHELVRWTLDQGWGGLENLSLIPGTVGAAPIQNIGAYGVEIESVFESLDAIDLADGSRRTFQHDECAFGYRDSVFKHAAAGRFVITSVLLRLPTHWHAETSYRDLADELAATGMTAPGPRDISDAVIAIRSRKLPDWHVIGNAGSFFKNPIVSAGTYAALRAAHPDLSGYVQSDGRFKLAAGWLIDRAGWKGRTLGHAGVYERQALVLVNRGGASGAEIMALAEAVRADVKSKFGVWLEPEPVVL